MNSLILDPHRNRDSNIELLRIVVIMSTVMLHAMHNMPGPGDGISLPEALRWRALTLPSFSSFGALLIISGYFRLRWKARHFWSLISTIVFWIGATFLAGYLITGQPVADVKDALHHFLFKGWFISVYLGLFFFAPMINTFIDSIDQRQLGRYLLIFLGAIFIFGFLSNGSVFAGSGLTVLIFFYMAGAYLRRCEQGARPKMTAVINQSPWWYLAIYLIITYIAVPGLAWLTHDLGFYTSLYMLANPGNLAGAIAIFLLFRRLGARSAPQSRAPRSAPHNPVVNWVGASAFSVYIFHCFTPMDPVLCRVTHDIFATGWNALWLWPLTLVAIFLFCALVDTFIQRPIFNFIFNRFHKGSPSAKES